MTLDRTGEEAAALAKHVRQAIHRAAIRWPRLDLLKTVLTNLMPRPEPPITTLRFIRLPAPIKILRIYS
jgi:hypothetical protein